MFDAQSRYAKQPTAVWVDRGGRSRTYVLLREVPQPPVPGPADPIYEVTDRDRLDRIAWRQLGAAELFWQLCDANGALHPDELIDRPGRTLRIPKGGRL